jgi:hypothetical protein
MLRERVVSDWAVTSTIRPSGEALLRATHAYAIPRDRERTSFWLASFRAAGGRGAELADALRDWEHFLVAATRGMAIAPVGDGSAGSPDAQATIG